MVSRVAWMAFLLFATAVHADPTPTLGQVLSSATPPQLLGSDEDHPCAISRVGDKRLQVALFAGLAAESTRQKVWSWALHTRPGDGLIAEMTDACGDELSAPLELAISSCTSASSFEASLSTIAALELEPPPLPELWRSRVDGRYWQAARELGCARTVASPDGRARVWTRTLETFGEASAKPIRGAGFLQWKDAQGTLHVYSDVSSGELHLDAIIDSLSSVAGAPGELVILGLRAYATTLPGKLPRRFAEVVHLNDEASTAELVHGAFRSAGQEFDRLLIAAPVAEKGKLRHSALTSRWLQADAASGELRLEAAPGVQSSNARPPLAASSQVIARRSDGHFLVEWPEHSELSLVQTW